MHKFHVQQYAGLNRFRQLTDFHHGPNHNLQWHLSLTLHHQHHAAPPHHFAQPRSLQPPEHGLKHLTAQVISVIAANPIIFRAIEAEPGPSFRKHLHLALSLTSSHHTAPPLLAQETGLIALQRAPSVGPTNGHHTEKLDHPSSMLQKLIL